MAGRFLKPSGPRNIRQVWHALWGAFQRIEDNVGGDLPTDPPTPVPPEDPAAHSHYIDNLINVTITTPIDGNQLRYEVDEWINYQEKFTEITAIDYTSTGLYDHETVICTNGVGVPVTITLQTLLQSDRVTVIRAGAGTVLVDGDGATIIGEATQNMSAQYDAADLIASDTEWVLK